MTNIEGSNHIAEVVLTQRMGETEIYAYFGRMPDLTRLFIAMLLLVSITIAVIELYYSLIKSGTLELLSLQLAAFGICFVACVGLFIMYYFLFTIYERPPGDLQLNEELMGFLAESTDIPDAIKVALAKVKLSQGTLLWQDVYREDEAYSIRRLNGGVEVSRTDGYQELVT